MSTNSERSAAELAELGHRTNPFTAPEQQGADGHDWMAISASPSDFRDRELRPP